MKESEKLSQEIESLEQKRTALLAKGDSILAVARKEMGAKAGDWIESAVRTAIEDNPAKAQALGRERLGELRAKVNDLKERLPTIIVELTDDSDVEHRSVAEGKTRVSRNEMYLTAVFRQAVGRLGDILVQFGLTGSKPGYIPKWETSGYGPQADRHRVSAHWQIEPPGPSAREYENMVGELFQLQNLIAAKREHLEKSKARELWESA
jgi:hypothetical protein